MSQPAQEFLFYDYETTGLNVAFDQPVQFAYQRIDAGGNLKKKDSFRVRLRPDVVPSLKALRVTGLSVAQLAEGVSEYEAACRIHREFNEPFTISIGFNSLGFDDKLSRFLFFRNLVDPYSHQWKNGCGRADLLGLLPVFKLFAPDVLTFPDRGDGTPTFALAAVASANGIEAHNAHDAAADVEMTVRLFQKMNEARPEIVQRVMARFSKKKDLAALDELKQVPSKSAFVKLAVLIQPWAHKDNYQFPAVLAKVEATGRQVWLHLETDFEAYLKGDDSQRPVVTFRRPGEIPFVLHSDKATVDEARRQLVRKNLKTIQAKGVEPFIQGMKPEFSNDQQLDLDASLYSGDFFGDFEACREEIAAFHGALVEEVRWSVAQRMPRDRFRELALRIIYRNGFDCPQAKRAGDDFVRARLEGKSSTVDFRGKERPSLLTLRTEIQAELRNGVDDEGRAFLKTVAEAFHLNLDEIEAEAGSVGSTAEIVFEGEETNKKESDGKSRMCECGLPLVERMLLVVDSNCWKCDSLMKIAMSATDEDGNEIGSPEDFTAEELKFAEDNGAIIQTVFSKTQERSYPANICPTCGAMTGDFYLTKHTPGFLEMTEGKAPTLIAKQFGWMCERC